MSDMNASEASAIPATCLDMNVITSLRELGGDDDPDLLTDLVSAFLSDSPTRMAKIEAASASGDSEGLLAAAHGLKSSAANMGALRLSELCRQLEKAGQTGQMESTQTLVEELKHEYSLAEKALMDLRSQD